MQPIRPWILVPLAACIVGCPAQDQAQRTVEAPPDLGAFYVTFIGHWEITPVARGGPSLAFVVDSAGAEGFRGRVTWTLAGDVVDDPSRYRPFRGTFSADSSARLEIYKEGIENPVYRLRVRATGDVLALLEYEWGGQSMLQPGTRWLARRIPAP